MAVAAYPAISSARCGVNRAARQAKAVTAICCRRDDSGILGGVPLPSASVPHVEYFLGVAVGDHGPRGQIAESSRIVPQQHRYDRERIHHRQQIDDAQQVSRSKYLPV